MSSTAAPRRSRTTILASPIESGAVRLDHTSVHFDLEVFQATPLCVFAGTQNTPLLFTFERTTPKAFRALVDVLTPTALRC